LEEFLLRLRLEVFLLEGLEAFLLEGFAPAGLALDRDREVAAVDAERERVDDARPVVDRLARVALGARPFELPVDLRLAVAPFWADDLRLRFVVVWAILNLPLLVSPPCLGYGMGTRKQRVYSLRPLLVRMRQAVKPTRRRAARNRLDGPDAVFSAPRVSIGREKRASNPAANDPGVLLTRCCAENRLAAIRTN
jgi:hypothetical protein